MRAVVSVILGMLLIGCAHQTSRSIPALHERHEHWFVQKAVAWFEAQRAARAAGQLSIGPFPEKDFDRHIPVKIAWADDKRWVSVSLPISVSKFREEWFGITFDTRTGELIGSGPSFNISD